jgi:dienelactone hydrolase
MRDPAADRLDSLAYTLARYREVEPALRFPLGQPQAVAAWRERARARLVERLGLPPAADTPLAPRFGPDRQRPGHIRRPVTFSTRPGLDAFGYLLIPGNLKTPAPAVVCLPGHGRGVDEIVGIDDDGKDRDHPDGYQHDFAVQAAGQGFVTLALEMLGFGHRRDPAARGGGASASSCQPAAGAALLLGESMPAWRAADTMRALDLLAGLPEVDAHRLGLVGISGGGTVALYTAALDPRVRATVLSGSFCTFRDSIYSISHCIDNYVPGILRDFEMADLVGLIAPRFVFVESGTRDPIFPRDGVQAAIDHAQAIYQALGAPGHLDHAFFEADHQFDGRAAFPRLRAWLEA